VCTALRVDDEEHGDQCADHDGGREEHQEDPGSDAPGVAGGSHRVLPIVGDRGAGISVVTNTTTNGAAV
jgi:hypothetical protein